MQFLADVNIAQSVIRFLRDHEYNVLDCKKGYLLAEDTAIIELAKRENRIILTRDKDYLSLLQLPKYKNPAIVFRLLDQSPEHIVKKLKELLGNVDDVIISQSLTVVFEDNASSSLL